MLVDAPVELMTAEEFLELPDDPSMEIELIQGELLEIPMTKRNPFHASSESMIAYRLLNWWEQQPSPRGFVGSGEIGCLLRRNPDTAVGIDVAYFPPGRELLQRGQMALIDGPPLLAVEILSPSDSQNRIQTKIDEYLTAGVPFVWIVDPRFKTVSVYRPDADPEMFSGQDEIDCEPHLPGFRVKVSSLFVL
jgi:Uma2 family endonuclease